MPPHKDLIPSILIVDDEEGVRNLLQDILCDEYGCVLAASAEEALEAFGSKQFGIVVSDINLGGMSGVEMIPHIHSRSPDTVVMMISGNLTIDAAIEAMRLGAFDYVRKPFDIDHVLAAVKRAATHYQLLVSKRQHEENLGRLVEERTAQLEFLTLHDALTNLPSRLLIKDRLERHLVRNRNGEAVATMLLTLDRLRMIRDTLGAEAADTVVVSAAERVSSAVGPEYTVGRLDGDVFAVLRPRTSPEEMLRLSACLVETLTASFDVNGDEVFVRPCMGISLYPSDARDVDEMLRNAGHALSQASSAPGASARFYMNGVNEFASQRLALESDLRHAIERGELSVNYQPKVCTHSGKIVGAEALARWTHPERGSVNPAEFIEIAESIGIIGKIGEWVLRKACTEFAVLPTLTVAVNVSRYQLQEPGFSAMVFGVLNETGLPAYRLNLEVTETAVMHDTAISALELSKLRAAGVKISIDDFGTGYSSLTALKGLPVDELKIDKSFISDVCEDEGDAALVKTVINLAKNLNLTVIAEGVETAEQLNMLRRMGCEEWQGYLCSKPVGFSEFTNRFAGPADLERSVPNLGSGVQGRAHRE
jgi:diguanylate cyclase